MTIQGAFILGVYLGGVAMYMGLGSIAIRKNDTTVLKTLFVALSWPVSLPMVALFGRIG